MRLSDVLEWLAACLAVAAAYVGVGLPLALAVAAVAVAYFAQCYDRPAPPAST